MAMTETRQARRWRERREGKSPRIAVKDVAFRCADCGRLIEVPPSVLVSMERPYTCISTRVAFTFENAVLRAEIALHEAQIDRALALAHAAEHCTFAERCAECSALIGHHVVALHRAGYVASAIRALTDVPVTRAA